MTSLQIYLVKNMMIRNKVMCFSQPILRSEWNIASKQWSRQCSDKVDNEARKLPIRRPKLNASDRLEKLLKDHEHDDKKELK